MPRALMIQQSARFRLEADGELDAPQIVHAALAVITSVGLPDFAIVVVKNPCQFGEGAEGDVVVDGVGEVSGPDESGEAVLVLIAHAATFLIKYFISLGMVDAVITAATPTTVVPEEIKAVVEGQLVADLVGGLDIQLDLPFVVLMIPAEIDARMPGEGFGDGEIAGGDVKHDLAFGFTGGRPLRAFRIVPVGVGEVERQAIHNWDITQCVVVANPVVPFFWFVLDFVIS